MLLGESAQRQSAAAVAPYPVGDLFGCVCAMSAGIVFHSRHSSPAPALLDRPHPPYRLRSFKLSRDIRFLEKLTDVVGLYLNPPDRSLVLCIDEKSQIQALDRTQPGLPLKKGRCGTFTHDYVRHGTTTLFAALEILEGKVIGQCFPRHRHQEFLRFLRRLDEEFPEKLKLHLVLDNYGTHKHPKVQSWLERHPRFTLHFIPTSSSWLNQVERWFGELAVLALAILLPRWGGK
jgi:hypothetical protein